MGFKTSSLKVNNQTQENKNLSLSPEQLNPQEIEILLSLIKRSTFLGEDIENLYNLVVKLQNQYINQTK